MDPVSYVFAAYLNSVQNTVQNRMEERHNTRLTPVEIQYQGVKVAFQHQSWRVRAPSVCGNVTHNIQAFSECTVIAKAMFQELCSQLSAKPATNWKHGRYQTMYCNAAIAYTPTIASVSAAPEQTELELARQACNAATAAAMGNREPGVLRERRELCEVYEGLKAE